MLIFLYSLKILQAALLSRHYNFLFHPKSFPVWFLVGTSCWKKNHEMKQKFIYRISSEQNSLRWHRQGGFDYKLHFFLIFCDHKSLRCPALVKLKVFELFLWEKKINKKILITIRALRWNSECFPCWFGLFNLFYALFEVHELKILIIPGESWLLSAGETSQKKNHPWILQILVILGLHQEPGWGQRGNCGIFFVSFSDFGQL